MCKFLLFAVALAFSILPARSAEVFLQSDQQSAPIGLETKTLALDPTLTKAYLTEPRKQVGSPQLIIGHYNVSQGLQAAYQSETGKRILFRARFIPGGGMVAQILHRDSTTGEVTQLIGKSKRLDETGKPVRDVEVAGIDMREYMKNSHLKSNGHAEKEQHLRQFVSDETGQSLIDGVPALYAALETLESTPELAKLKEPFGAVAMALQLTTKTFSGFKHADTLLGAGKARELRDACGGAYNCAFRGKHFMIHASGFFDVLSKHKGAPAHKSESVSQLSIQSNSLGFLTRQTSPELVEQLMQSSTSENHGLRKNGGGTCTNPGPCFGACGPGCLTPGDIYTPQCLGHDYCVCAYGHDECLITVPDDCGAAQGMDCSSLWEAVGSYFGGLWDAFWDWVDRWFEEPKPCEPGQICQSG